MFQLPNPRGSQVTRSENVFVEQLQQLPERILPSAVRRGCEQQQVFALLGKSFGREVSLGFVRFFPVIVGRKFVRFVDNNQVPVWIRSDVHDIVARNEIYGSYDPFGCMEDVRIRGEMRTVSQGQRQVKLNLHFVFLPLFCESAGCDDQDSLNNFPHQQLLYQQPRHDRLACPRIIG